MNRRVGILATAAIVVSLALLASHFKVWYRLARVFAGPRGEGGVDTP